MIYKVTLKSYSTKTCNGICINLEEASMDENNYILQFIDSTIKKEGTVVKMGTAGSGNYRDQNASMPPMNE